MYIGKQKIIKTAPEGENIRVELEPYCPKGTEIEHDTEIILNKDDYEAMVTEIENDDLTTLRNNRNKNTIGEILLILIRHNTRREDLEHVFQSVLTNIDRAEKKKERKFYGNHEFFRTIGQYEKELME